MIRAAAGTRARTTDAASLHLFGAHPDLPTRALVDELRSTGVTVRAHYRDAPVDDSGGVPLSDDDLVIGTPDTGRREWRDWLSARDAHVLLAGSPVSTVDVLRRAAVLRRSRTVHLWGERPRNDQVVVRTLRRSALGSWGLDGVFAVGTRAVDTYRAVTGRDVPVHVLPWVTDRGADVTSTPAIRPTIGYTGRLAPDKGLDLLLRALARLSASERPRLQVAGSGPGAAALRARADRLGIERWVDWLGDVEGAELDNLRSRWWALIVPTQRPDGWGTDIQAALNSGVPVVSSHHAHAATDLIRPGRNGVIVRRDDPDKWAAAIAEAIAPTTRRARSVAARAVGRAFAPRHAASWLLEVLAAAELARRTGGDRLASRSFVDHAWAHLVPDEHSLDVGGPQTIPLTPLAH